MNDSPDPWRVEFFDPLPPPQTKGGPDGVGAWRIRVIDRCFLCGAIVIRLPSIEERHWLCHCSSTHCFLEMRRLCGSMNRKREI